MRVVDMGIRNVYEGDFNIHREKWDRDYLFLYFHTKCQVEMGEEVIDVRPHSVIIYEIGSGQHYHAAGDSYSDDYVHFLFDEGRSFLDELNLPLNTVIPLTENEEIPALLRHMYEEFVSVNVCREMSMECYFRLILMKISEVSERIRQTKVPARYDEQFRNLRSEIFLYPERDWHVTECAADQGLSTPYFQKLYKLYFKNTFVQDVVKSRIEQAKHCLIMTNCSVKEIAATCGYRNETFFMKQFKKMTGMTPSKYRERETSRESGF